MNYYSNINYWTGKWFKLLKKLTLFGISKICKDNNILNRKNDIKGVIYFSSKISRINSFSLDTKYKRKF